jgi:hypothetical protein
LQQIGWSLIRFARRLFKEMISHISLLSIHVFSLSNLFLILIITALKPNPSNTLIIISRPTWSKMPFYFSHLLSLDAIKLNISYIILRHIHTTFTSVYYSLPYHYIIHKIVHLMFFRLGFISSLPKFIWD